MYNINNLKVISRNISRYNSNIYNKNKINYMIKKKKNLIKQYDYITTSIFKQKLSLVNNSNNSNINIINKINQLTNLLSIVIHSLDKIEEEEKLIMRVFKISNYSIINCLNNYF
jgi:hypothetical protein